MILLRDLGFSRNGEALVSGATLQLHPGWKVGLTGDEAADMAQIASCYEGRRGYRHEQASPIRLL